MISISIIQKFPVLCIFLASLKVKKNFLVFKSLLNYINCKKKGLHLFCFYNTFFLEKLFSLFFIAENPDLVIFERMEEKMDIFELTVPLETNIKNANAQKMNKYEHFITDITTRDVSVHPNEIGSRGYISPSNKANIKKLHKFCNYTHAKSLVLHLFFGKPCQS